MAGEMNSRRAPDILLSFDVEDWHQLRHRQLGRRAWDEAGEPFPRQMSVLLALLDELDVRATFFVLGVTAKNYAPVIADISAVADMRLPVTATGTSAWIALTGERFLEDLRLGKKIIEETIGLVPDGYRAPFFSLSQDSPWAFGSSRGSRLHL